MAVFIESKIVWSLLLNFCFVEFFEIKKDIINNGDTKIDAAMDEKAQPKLFIK